MRKRRMIGSLIIQWLLKSIQTCSMIGYRFNLATLFGLYKAKGCGMSKKITRRSLFRKGARWGAISLLGSSIMSYLGCKASTQALSTEDLDIAVVGGENIPDMVKKALYHLGGMEKFVPEGSKVCLLPNAQRNNPGTYTKPEIVRAVVDMCFEAGAREVACLSWLPKKSWDSAGFGKVFEDTDAQLMIVDLKDELRFKPVPVPNGVILKEARIMDLFFDNQIFINLPICKDHVGNRFTGTLKNLMGLNSPQSNRTFHTGNFKNDNIEHLDQCIADLNTVITPALCVVDATEFIVTNGPFGPGEIKRPMKIVAGTDRVAIDAYCSTLWDLNPKDIIMIERAHQHSLGEIDFQKKKIKEAVL